MDVSSDLWHLIPTLVILIFLKLYQFARIIFGEMKGNQTFICVTFM